MERNWEPRAEAPVLASEEVRARLRPYASGRRVTGYDVLAGGLVNLNIRVGLEDPEETVVLRVFLRDPSAAGKEAAVLRLVAGRLPAPRVLAASLSGPRPHLLLTHVPGLPLTGLFESEDPRAHARAGIDVGRSLARLHAEARTDLGFLDATLAVPQPMGGLAEVWTSFVRAALFEGRAGGRLGIPRRDALWLYAQQEGPRLDALEGDYAVLHADCKPTNVRVAPTGALTGLIDWEFAWSGPPLFDLGQMLRWPVPEPYERSLLEHYVGEGGRLPENWRALARQLDLLNLVGFLDMAEERPTVFKDCLRMIAETVGS